MSKPRKNKKSTKLVLALPDLELEQKGYAPNTINLRLAAVRRAAYEACDSGLLSPGQAPAGTIGHRHGGVRGDGITPKVLWEVVKEAATRAGIEKLAPHDLRRTCAHLCHLASGELDQIPFLPGTYGFRRPKITSASRG